MRTASPNRKYPAIMVNLEGLIEEIVKDVAAREAISASAFVRKLIIKDLRDRGLLPDRLLAEIAVN